MTSQEQEMAIHHGSGNVLKDLDIVMTREEWAALCEKHGSKMPYPYAEVIPFRRTSLSKGWE